MKKFGWPVAFGLLTLLLPGGAAHAQWFYPPGYGDWGWGGWGWGGVGTVQGDVARGLGTFAQGAGVYNLKTAEAKSINADTAMRWNQYLWQSQQEANKRYFERQARARQDNVRNREEIYNRLRNNPEQRDIHRGDALNVVLDEVSNPRVYLRNLKAATAKIPGPMIRQIPFQYAAAAITTSYEQLTRGGPPEALKAPAFASEASALKAVAAELRKQDEEKGSFDPATLQKARTLLEALRAKVVATLPRGTRQRDQAERYVKGLLGLTRMLETPAIDVLLAGVENRPETNLGALVTFMESFNLRFGVANTNEQRQAYSTIYPLLVKLRDEAYEGLKGETNVTASNASGEQGPGEFFSAMDFDQLQAKKPAPAAPKPNQK